MSINVNKEIIKEILNERTFENELREFLNEVIDEEVNKFDDMDDELVSQCIDALYELDNEGTVESAVQKLSSANIIRFCHKKNFRRTYVNKRVVAVFAAVLIITSSLSATVFADDIEAFVQQIISMLDKSAQETDDGSDEYSSLTVVTPDNFNPHISSIDEANLDGCLVYVTDYDGRDTYIKLSDCKIDKKVIKEDEMKTVIVTVSYKGCPDSVTYFLDKGESK